MAIVVSSITLRENKRAKVSLRQRYSRTPAGLGILALVFVACKVLFAIFGGKGDGGRKVEYYLPLPTPSTFICCCAHALIREIRAREILAFKVMEQNK